MKSKFTSRHSGRERTDDVEPDLHRGMKECCPWAADKDWPWELPLEMNHVSDWEIYNYGIQKCMAEETILCYGQ